MGNWHDNQKQDSKAGALKGHRAALANECLELAQVLGRNRMLMPQHTKAIDGVITAAHALYTELTDAD